jgi:uncharacterized RDD family membrane protein YckC
MASVPTSGSAPPPPVWDATPQQAGVVRYAGFWLRVVAWIVDMIALAILWQIISLFFPAPPPPPDSADADVLWQYWLDSLPPGKMLASTLISWAYFALQESSSAQATVGKRLFGIRVSTEGGARLSIGASTIRTWPLYLNSAGWIFDAWLGGLISLLALVACVSVAFSSRKQGLHDKMAGAVLTRR